MSKLALVRLGPRATAGLLNSGVAKRTLYGDVTKLPRTPVVIDHDKDREIGEVLELFTMQDAVPHGVPDAAWLCARVRLDDRAPAWARKGTGASMKFLPGHRNRDFFGWDRMTSAVMFEVTLCSAASTPVEPLAGILYLEDEKPKRPVAARAPRRAVSRAAVHWAIGHRPRSHEEADEFRARVALAERAGLRADVEGILRQLRRDLGNVGASLLDECYEQHRRQRLAA